MNENLSYLEKLGNTDAVNCVCFFTTKHLKKHVLDIGKVGWLDVAERKGALWVVEVVFVAGVAGARRKLEEGWLNHVESAHPTARRRLVHLSRGAAWTPLLFQLKYILFVCTVRLYVVAINHTKLPMHQTTSKRLSGLVGSALTPYHPPMSMAFWAMSRSR